MNRRPNAFDRSLADVFRRLKPGDYDIRVENPGMKFMGLARLKTEGGFDIAMEDGKTISIMPRLQTKAA